jgi:hypothetical protein
MNNDSAETAKHAHAELADRKELDEIVRHSTERAESMYPKRIVSWRMRIVFTIVGVLLVGNSVLNIVDTTILSKATACQKQQSKTITALRNSNQVATTTWINTISNDIKNKKLTALEIEKARIAYNKQVADNNAQISQAVSIKCNK